jgi:hypothetical protein|tara:strand:+ start:8142 stop:8282 length:141 start_codon:yes stop_codon:yes gene_type:complete
MKREASAQLKMNLFLIWQVFLVDCSYDMSVFTGRRHQKKPKKYKFT